MSVSIHTILWRRLDQPGHESARVAEYEFERKLTGSAVFMGAGQPCRLDYDISTNAVWETLLAYITGWVGNTAVDLTIWTDEAGRWWMNDVEFPDVQGCIDLDLSFSGATNLLPIHRLGFKVGDEHEVVSAWLLLPDFRLERLTQRYRRVSESTYHYWSDNGFETELTVNEGGFVTEYPPLWTEERYKGSG